jgi:arginase family enzyme
MSINEYIKPLSSEFVGQLKSESGGKSLAQYVAFNEQNNLEINAYKIAILGVGEDRLKDQQNGSGLAPNEIRKGFYALVKPRYDISIVDLGNIVNGNSISDTYYALKQSVNHLIQNKILPVIIGGSQDLAYAQYAAHEKLNSNMNVMLLDARVEVNVSEDDDLQSSYISKIISHQPFYLFNIALAGYQSYFVENESYDAFERMNFDMVRLGNLRNKIQDIEPLCRNAHMLSFSASAIRASDAPGQNMASPNGFSGEEACAICRYAGMSSDLESFGLYDFNPSKDKENYTVQLAAQMLWYFVDGFYGRKNDYPAAESKDYMIYRTTFKNSSHEIIFYKSLSSDRWWMEVPYPKERSSHSGKFLVPCSYSDYQIALNDEIPDRWMKAYQKLI